MQKETYPGCLTGCALLGALFKRLVVTYSVQLAVRKPVPVPRAPNAWSVAVAADRTEGDIMIEGLTD